MHSCFNRVQLFVAPWTVYSPPGSSVHGDPPGKSTGVGCHALLQGISPTQGSNLVSHTAGRFFTSWANREAQFQVSVQFSLSVMSDFLWPQRFRLPSVNMWIQISLQDVVAVQLLSYVQLFVTPWTAARQASLSFTLSWSLLKLTSIESVMPSNHLILCRPLLLPPSIFPSIRVFASEMALGIRRPKYWSFGFSNSPANEYSELVSFSID